MQCNPTDILIFAENKVPAERPRSRVLMPYWFRCGATTLRLSL